MTIVGKELNQEVLPQNMENEFSHPGHRQLIRKILNNSRKINEHNVHTIRRIIILFKTNFFYIGDTLDDLSNLRAIKYCFENASIDFLCANMEHKKYITALLKNNPFVENVYFTDLENINFKAYDLIIIASFDEKMLIKFLFEKYGLTINISLCNLRGLVNDYEKIFPRFEEVFGFQLPFEKVPEQYANEVFITPDEKKWGYNWLKENGLKQNEKLIIFIDESTERRKALRFDTHFKVLEWFLNKKNVKILIFDHRNTGKEIVYGHILGTERCKNLIFCKNLDLRKSFYIISSNQTRIIFGPSSGLLHCASGIFNTFKNKNMILNKDIPLMLTYTGKFDENRHYEWRWWEYSLVNCMVIRKDEKLGKVIKLLQDCPRPKELFLQDFLYCEDYTSEMIIEFINSNYYEKLKYFDLL